MKIKVEKWITDEYNNSSYKIKSIEKCCDKLIKSKNISINTEYCEYDGCYEDGSYLVKLVRKEEETEPWEDFNQTNYYYENITHCPFCGEKIKIEFIGEVNKQEELKQLEKERDEIWKKCRKTDSKKKEQEFENKVHELDNKINVIY
jgi:hypothetical protein